jgi:two-component system, NtrC family, sensor kinase
MERILPGGPRTSRSAPRPQRRPALAGAAPLQRVARAFAGGDDLDHALAAGLRAVRTELGAAGVSVWLHDGAQSRREAHAGRDGCTAADAQRWRAVRRMPPGDPCVVPLRAGRQSLGLLVVRLGRAPTAGERAWLGDVAGLLAPVLRQTQRTRQLEATVAAGSREIEEQRAFFERIVDTLPVGLYVIDRDYRVRAWNSKRETGLQGVARREVLGHTIFEVLHRQPAAVLRQEFEALFATGDIQQFQAESNATGEPRVYRLTKIPMRDDAGGISHAITIGEDITEWKQAEARIAQAEKLAALGTLAAGVMHEINNPLATIAAASEALEMRVREGQVAGDALVTELYAVLGLIAHEVSRCSGIVGGVLDFSRPKPAHREPVAVNDIVQRTLFLLGHHARFKDLHVDTALAADVPLVLGNDEQLIQVLMALLLNAMDAVEAGATIHLRTACAPDGDVIVEVEDHGQGIRRADLPRIFEPFFTTKSVGRGTGLGLSVCYSIVSDHGGRIEVHSSFGHGSTFTIVLPAASGGRP